MVAVTAFTSARKPQTQSVASQTELRSLFRQAEQDLYRSKPYRHALSQIQEEHGNYEAVQAALRDITKEAIRLTLRQMYYKPNADENAPLNEPSSSDKVTVVDAEVLLEGESKLLIHQFQKQETCAPSFGAHCKKGVSSIAVRPLPTKTPMSLTRSVATSTVRLSKKAQQAELEAERVAAAREAALKQIGHELSQLRIAKSMSVEELHHRTKVPVHQIRALESGQIEWLPEDIYVRGFIQRIGDALNLDGRAIANLLPISAAEKSVVPSWYHPTESTNTTLHPIHLYVGYTALMAGAMGSLAWLAQQPMSSNDFQVNLDLQSLNPFQESFSLPRWGEADLEEVRSGVGSLGMGAIALPDTAAPETGTSSFNSQPFSAQSN
jgi:hypothetical protein